MSRAASYVTGNDAPAIRAFLFRTVRETLSRSCIFPRGVHFRFPVWPKIFGIANSPWLVQAANNESDIPSGLALIPMYSLATRNAAPGARSHVPGGPRFARVRFSERSKR